ncbi:MAG: RdgB/HAM1 family non-canonical purine NTP pyrophosphatase [Chitinophagaceae bacterium]|nr:RdgB/HAM1 family non-canonical purine NTP pyrophosphatase [Chitinophagaceae bacterium]
MQQLIFATNNSNKIKEIKAVLKGKFDIITLEEAGIDIDIPEPHDTLEANAFEKARVIYGLTKKNCFSEDTGLEVQALNNEPGVKSARYAGEKRSFKDNIKLLLTNLQQEENRKARFRTVISLILNKKEYQFEGICEGYIAKEEKGNNGFGYDAVFIPADSNKTFAEMNMEEKNKYSHRKKAVQKLIDFLDGLEH